MLGYGGNRTVKWLQYTYHDNDKERKMTQTTLLFMCISVLIITASHQTFPVNFGACPVKINLI